MYGFVLMLLILDALVLVLVVLLQSGKGAGLAAEFGGASSSSDTFLGGRQAATLLTKASWVTGGIFMGLALLLAILSARTRAPSSILEGQLQAPVQQEAPTPLLEREAQPPAQAPTGEGGGDEGGQADEGSPPEGGN
ncbi:MAG: preprotein translocase subunit SecG [Gemmatimonadetes bacterium]|uniref:Protein-export membrane protein SecG n=1 Tax=Candidatus Kutchimonas denitrificans TaxID=3056748 RepID=A0AAE5CC42_9BACT|nr:preprotein translocase subunit SecG [Gemmatimonadota bacterium]NIR75195.1 preprotein translocase subunit SecG [Candidatus Kutchimonas denitrificans]NIS00133.1 preprotein translocase subunit SecG [Gemmatimonadota bacterium]NIT65725.1 preprotein translocase subunit SecG [Gemmatimonadota bacterium]NIU53003.1 preprotein translocase subunit SecG [Gemmatimonadota bacterium]